MSFRDTFRRRRFYRLRIPAGFAFAGAAILLAEPTGAAIALGLAFALPGQALRVWASGHIEKAVGLATGGPYAFVQHPLYLGSLLNVLGVAVACAQPLVLALASVYFLALYPHAMREEHEFLARRFGADYAAWTSVVPRLVPRPTPAGPRASRFRWSRVLRNHEWQTCLVLAAAISLLLWRLESP